jgi:hypothetical protein
VAAGGGDGTDIAARRTAKQDTRPVDLYPAHIVFFELALVQNRGELVGTGPLEDVPVDP